MEAKAGNAERRDPEPRLALVEIEREWLGQQGAEYVRLETPVREEELVPRLPLKPGTAR